MIHPDTELQFISDEIGYGVVARKFIPQGTITWVLDELDREYSPNQIRQMDEVYREVLMTYTFRNNCGNHIFCWDHGRYMNHSFRPNCMATPYMFEIAIRDIHPGEQLTNDYGYLNIIEPFTPYPEGTSRTTIYPDDLLRHAEEWDQLIQPVFIKIPNIDQPLKPVLGDERWLTVERICAGHEPMKSIRNCYYQPVEE